MNKFQKWISGCLALLLVCCLCLAPAQITYAVAPEIASPHCILMEATTGTVLAEKDADAKVSPASITKIMTVLLIFEQLEQGNIALDDLVTTSSYAKSMGGSQVYLEEGEQQTVDTMLKCILISSGNDAAVAMAEYIAGSETAFVEKMNEKAKQLGMTHTHFVDCCGLTEDNGHYTSARDVAVMSRELVVHYPQVYQYTGIWMDTIVHETKQGKTDFGLSNTNKLLRSYEGCTGLKTGSTSVAKYCLSATASRNGVELISVIMTAPDSKIRFQDAAVMLNFGFGICSVYRDEKRERLSPRPVTFGAKENVSCDYEKEFQYVSVTKEDFSKIEKVIEWKETIKAPVKEGTVLGTLSYSLEGKVLGSVAIVAKETVEKADYHRCLEKIWYLFI